MHVKSHACGAVFLVAMGGLLQRGVSDGAFHSAAVAPACLQSGPVCHTVSSERRVQGLVVSGMGQGEVVQSLGVRLALLGLDVR